MEKIKIQYGCDEAVIHISLDDGKGNILDHIMLEEIQQTLNKLRGNQRIKLIVFESDGRHFSYGASVDEHQKEFAETMLHTLHNIFYTLQDLGVPTLAQVQGMCLGGGMELALMCNFIMAEKSAKFGQPEILLGVYAPGASILLPEKIGLARAEELLLTGKTLTALEAKAIGLINEVYEDRATMLLNVQDFIRIQILPKSATSLRFAVKASRMKFNHVLKNFLPQLESMYIHKLMESYDANEGINSFLEKRSPVWEQEKV